MPIRVKSSTSKVAVSAENWPGGAEKRKKKSFWKYRGGQK